MILNRALIVGAGGQVGSALSRQLGPAALRAGRGVSAATPIALDLVDVAQQPELAGKALASLQPQAVLCVGGATDVERCESDVGWAMATNCNGPAALAAASTALPFVFFSTDYVFDGVAGPFDEDRAPRPLSMYGWSKWQGELAILRAHPKALILRTTVVYGPDRQGKNFLYTLQRTLGAGKPLRVAEDQISTPTYNVDLASAAIELAEAGCTGIVNVCGPELVSRYDFAVQAAEQLGLDARLLVPVPTSELKQRALRPLSAGLVTTRLQRVLRSTRMRTNAEAIRDWQALEADVAA